MEYFIHALREMVQAPATAGNPQQAVTSVTVRATEKKAFKSTTHKHAVNRKDTRKQQSVIRYSHPIR